MTKRKRFDAVARTSAIAVFEDELKTRSDGYVEHLAHGGKADCGEEFHLDALYMAIAALREQESLAKKQATSDWISVEDRLPEGNGHYLVYEVWAYGSMVSLAFYTPKYNGFEQHLNGRAIWYKYDSEYGDFEVTGVTHWMPLPEPPKEEV